MSQRPRWEPPRRRDDPRSRVRREQEALKQQRKQPRFRFPTTTEGKVIFSVACIFAIFLGLYLGLEAKIGPVPEGLLATIGITLTIGGIIALIAMLNSGSRRT